MTMRKVAILVIFLAACTRPAGGPPQVRFGQDVCARCGMIISEPRFASGYRKPDGETVAYDDLGEFWKALQADPSLGKIAYVSDFNQQGWLPAQDCVYVLTPGFATPMGSGMVAFREPKAAQAFADSHPGAELLSSAHLFGGS